MVGGSLSTPVYRDTHTSMYIVLDATTLTGSMLDAQRAPVGQKPWTAFVSARPIHFNPLVFCFINLI